MGNFITMWGSEGEGDGQFLHPYGLGIDSSDNVYVTDAELLNIQKFDNNFSHLGKGRYNYGSNGRVPVHNIGEIWCATLCYMNRKIEEKLGQDSNTFANGRCCSLGCKCILWLRQ